MVVGGSGIRLYEALTMPLARSCMKYFTVTWRYHSIVSMCQQPMRQMLLSSTPLRRREVAPFAQSEHTLIL
eukprot:1974462-Ditylum_brightwellii.AAC.1